MGEDCSGRMGSRAIRNGVYTTIQCSIRGALHHQACLTLRSQCTSGLSLRRRQEQGSEVLSKR